MCAKTHSLHDDGRGPICSKAEGSVKSPPPRFTFLSTSELNPRPIFGGNYNLYDVFSVHISACGVALPLVYRGGFVTNLRQEGLHLGQTRQGFIRSQAGALQGGGSRGKSHGGGHIPALEYPVYVRAMIDVACPSGIQCLYLKGPLTINDPVAQAYASPCSQGDHHIPGTHRALRA